MVASENLGKKYDDEQAEPSWVFKVQICLINFISNLSWARAHDQTRLSV